MSATAKRTSTSATDDKILKARKRPFEAQNYISELQELRSENNEHINVLDARIASFYDDIAQFKQYRSEAEQLNEKIQADIDQAIIEYSKESCRGLAEAFHAALPLELRNMVYEHLLDIEEESGNLSGVCEVIMYNIGDTEYQQDTDDDPYFILPEYVGKDVPVEILGMLYRRLFTTYYAERGASVLKGIYTADVYHSGLTPLRFIRKLSVTWATEGVGEPLRDPKFWPTRTIRPAWTDCFESLLSVQEKDRFEFHFMIYDHCLSLKHLGHLLDIFRPVYNTLIAAGSRISLQYGLSDPLCDLTEYFSKPAEQWRADMKRVLVDQEWDEVGDCRFDEWSEWVNETGIEPTPSELDELERDAVFAGYENLLLDMGFV